MGDRADLLRHTIGNVVLVLVILVGTAALYHRAESHVSEVAFESHTALCAFKSDLERRHDSGVEFLEKHPAGIPGISAADIRRSLANQQATLDSLEALNCS